MGIFVENKHSTQDISLEELFPKDEGGTAAGAFPSPTARAYLPIKVTKRRERQRERERERERERGYKNLRIIKYF